MARIVLNGCLTAAGSALPVLSRGASAAEREEAHDQLRKALRRNLSLADTIRAIAAQKGFAPGQVSAANASIGSEVSLIDPATGELRLDSPRDPMLTSADKFAYVAQAGEATGAGRALVACLLEDRARAKESVERRLKHSEARSAWDDSVIKALYTHALMDLDDIAFINQAADLAGPLSEIQYPATAISANLMRAPVDVLARMLTYIETEPTFDEQDPPLMKLIVYQAWLVDDKSTESFFLDALSHYTVQEAADKVDLPLIAERLGSLLPGALAKHKPGDLRLALLDVATNGAGAHPASIAYLRQRRTGAQFTDPDAITQALGGMSNAAAIREHIKEPDGAAVDGAAAPLDLYNIDLDEDGINDAFVEPGAAVGMTPFTTDVISGPMRRRACSAGSTATRGST